MLTPSAADARSGRGRLALAGITAVLCVAVLGCAASGPPVETLAEESLADGLPGMTLLGAREQASSGGGVTGVEVFAQVERFYASGESVAAVAEEFVAGFAQEYGLSRRERPDGGVQLQGRSGSVAATVTITLLPPQPQPGEELSPPPRDTESFVVVLLAGQP